ncbi:MAG: hypothetical protein R6X06_05465 [Gammaproteobacteria bacterium]
MKEQTDPLHQWLQNMQRSVQDQDLEQHMALVSKRVQIYGLPRKEVVDYPQWRQRRHNEFRTRRLVALQHAHVKIKTLGLVRIAFNVDQSLIAKDGVVYIINKDIMLEKEADGVWRVIEETIHHWNQRQYQLAAGEHE